MKNTTLRAARIASGKTQAEVAAESGISATQHQNVEYNKSETSVLNAISIAKTLGIDDFAEFCALWEQQSPPDGSRIGEE